MKANPLHGSAVKTKKPEDRSQNTAPTAGMASGGASNIMADVDLAGHVKDEVEVADSLATALGRPTPLTRRCPYSS